MSDRLRLPRREVLRRNYAPEWAWRVLHDREGYRVLAIPCPKGVCLVGNLWCSRIADLTWYYPWGQYLNFGDGHFGGEIVKFLRKVSLGAAGHGVVAPPPDPEFEAAYPALWEYLTVTSWGKDQPRRTSTITLFSDDGAWKVSLNDRDQGYGLFATGSTLENALETLEELLTAPAGPPWRKNREWRPEVAVESPKPIPRKRRR